MKRKLAGEWMDSMKSATIVSVVTLLASACSAPHDPGADAAPIPSRIIDLTPTITVDQPLRTWGSKMLSDYGFRQTNEFEFVITRDPLYVSNAYWTLFNHTGAHLDAWMHLAT